MSQEDFDVYDEEEERRVKFLKKRHPNIDPDILRNDLAFQLNEDGLDGIAEMLGEDFCEEFYEE